MNWEICSWPVYAGSGVDQSIPSTLSVLPNVIEKSERVAIVHGLAVRTQPIRSSEWSLIVAILASVGLHPRRRRD